MKPIEIIRESRERERTLLRALDETYLTFSLAPGRVTYTGAVTEPVNGEIDVMRFPDGASTFARTTQPTRQLWAATRPRLTVWYTSPIGDTSNFTFRWVFRTFGAGSTTSNTVFTVDFSAPGPAVANTVQTVSVVGTAKFPSSPFGVTHVLLGRLGAADANNRDLDVLLATITMEEIV